MEWIVLLGVLVTVVWAFTRLVGAGSHADHRSGRTDATRIAVTRAEVSLEDDSPMLESPPALPYVCRVPSQSCVGIEYTVKIDSKGNWSCTCPDFKWKRARSERWQYYYCKHCNSVGKLTGLKQPRRWRAKNGNHWLVGEILKLDDGSSRMTVDGYVTSRELYELHDMTPALVRKFLPTPDEVALFRGEDGCDLYDESRVRDVLKSRIYLDEREKTERRRKAARKGAKKRAATLAANRALEEAAEAKRRDEFGGSVWLSRCHYKYGWLELGTYARDMDHARTLLSRWLRSDEGRDETTRLYEDAVAEYEACMEDYRGELREGTPVSQLSRPRKPVRGEFVVRLGKVMASRLHTADYGIEDVQIEQEDDGWRHDIFGDPA